MMGSAEQRREPWEAARSYGSVHMTAILVRRALPADAEAIADVHVRVRRWAYRGQMPDDYLRRLNVERRAQRWRQDLAGDELVTWVADVVGRVVGFAGSTDAGDDDVPPGTAELAMINVLEAHTRQGVGRALMAAVEDHWQANGYRHAVLWVLAANDGARTFYERQGWAPDGAERDIDFGGTGLRALRLARQVG